MNTRPAFLCLLASLVLVTSSWGAGYIKFDGVDGESTGKKDDKSSLWMRVAQAGDEDLAGALRASKDGTLTRARQHKPFTFSKPVDKASPKLQEACAKGTEFPSVEVGGGEATYELKNVIVTSVQAGIGRDSGYETVTLNYEKIVLKEAGEVRARAVERIKAATPVRAPE